MLANTFSHGLIRDYVVSFGTLFNNIKINRRAASGEGTDTIAIPLAYAPQQRYLARITEDLNLDRPVALTLPRMSFEMISLNYSSERKLNTMSRWVGHKPTANTLLKTTYSPVPYDFNFQLSIYISNIEDGTHVVEQILPYFTPEFTVSLKSATDLGINMDIPIVLNAVNMEDNYEGGFEERRIIIWTLDFTLKGNLFGPIRDAIMSNKVIINVHPQTANISFDSEGRPAANDYEQVVSQVAMFANGTPTSDFSLSVIPNLISVNSDYGISQSIFSVGEDPNTHKRWDFTDGAYIATVAFGPATGNTTIDGWESFEVGAGHMANGTVALSQIYSHLRHTITKRKTGIYQQSVILQNFSNSISNFKPFYGKQYQSVVIKYKTTQTSGSAAVHTSHRHLRWLTTNTNEDLEFSTGTIQGSTPRFNDGTVSQASGAPGPLPSGYSTIEWDLSETTDWNDRIITALKLNLFNVTDNDDAAATFVTDIDYIEIRANTG